MRIRRILTNMLAAIALAATSLIQDVQVVKTPLPPGSPRQRPCREASVALRQRAKLFFGNYSYILEAAPICCLPVLREADRSSRDGWAARARRIASLSREGFSSLRGACKPGLAGAAS